MRRWREDLPPGSVCVYFKCFPSAGAWTPGVIGFTETSAIGIAGMNWDLMRIEAGCGKKKIT